MSVPLQQTARYICEYGEELTQEEREIIDRVIDVEACRRDYSPRMADPVKSSFREDATKREVLRYLGVWAKMFLKHPGCYVSAFLSNTYGYFYFGDAAVWKYDMGESENVQSLINPQGFYIHHIEALHSLSTGMDQYEKLFNRFPVVSLFHSCTFYTWTLIILAMLLLRGGKIREIAPMVPCIVSLMVCFASPYNGINDFRYMFPIAFCSRWFSG